MSPVRDKKRKMKKRMKGDLQIQNYSVVKGDKISNVVKVAIKNLTQRTLNIKEEFPASLFGEEIPLRKPVRVDLKLNKSADKVSVRGTVETAVKLSCSRCLGDFSYDIDTDVDIVYQPFRKGTHEFACREAAEGEELKRDDFGIATYTEPVLSLGGDIREAIHLAVPMKPLCSEECQGLCPGCGQNLNIKRCECVTHSIRKKFSELGKLFEGKDEQTR